MLSDWLSTSTNAPVQVKNGTVYEGIYHTAQLADKEVSVVLKMAKVVQEPGQRAPQGPAPPTKTLVIHSAGK